MNENELIKEARKMYSYEQALFILKEMRNNEKFLTKGVGKLLAKAYSIDIEHIVDDSKI